MAYTFARIGAVVSLTPQDYLQVGKRSLIRFREKGGKEKEIPVHHKLEEYLDVYLEAAKLSERPASPLFQSTRGRSRELSAIDCHAKTLGRWASSQAILISRLRRSRRALY
jgi:site-specific recombinase XerC